MIANIVLGKSFRPTLLYNLKKVEQQTSKWLDKSFVADDENSIIKEVDMVRLLRPNLNKFFYHISLNFPPWENLENDLIKLIAKDYLKQMGFDLHQYAIFKHEDAGHPHVHILVNRISFDGDVVSNYNDYLRSEKILRRLEETYNLTKVILSKEAEEKSITKNELEMMIRTDEPSVKMKLQLIIKEVLVKKTSAEQFIQLLEAQGINILFNQASTGFVSGISYGYEGMHFKGAHLGNAYKWQAIKNGIGYEQERDRTAIHEANIRTRAIRSERTAESEAGTIPGPAARADKIGRDRKITDNHTENLSPGTGRLQHQIAKANQQDAVGNGNPGKHHQADGVPDTNVPQQRAADRQAQQRGGQQVGDQALPDSDLIRDRLGPGHDAGHMDQAALNEFKKKKKKRRGHRL